MHPLAGDLTKLTDKELGERIIKLIRVLRTSGLANAYMYDQAYMMYQTYLAEQQRRFQKILDEQLAKAGNDKFNDIINIG